MTAYCTMKFLEELSLNPGFDMIDFNPSTSGESKIALIYLIFNAATIKTDCSDLDIELKLNNPYINHLFRKGKIKSAELQFGLFKSNDEERFFDEINEQFSILLLDNVPEKRLKRYEDNYGYHCISQHNDFSVLFRENLKTFRINESISWEFARFYFTPHNSIVIADPYLYNTDTLYSLVDLIKNTASTRLKKKYYISLIGSSGNNDESFLIKSIEKALTSLIQILPTINLIIDYHFYNGREFHDRYIITNNTYIVSGYGLDLIKKGVSKKDGTWFAVKPYDKMNINGINGVYFYKTMQEKLSMMMKWIEKGSTKFSSNPLLS